MNKLEAYLRMVAEDPMWADHVEMRKSTVVNIADALSTLERERDEARANASRAYFEELDRQEKSNKSG